MSRPRRLLTVGHSYVVALNRRLAHEMARVGGGVWEVYVAAPQFVHGDLRPIPLEVRPDESCHVVPVAAYLTNRIHLMCYGRMLKKLLAEGWDVVHAWEEPYILAGAQIARWTPRSALLFFASFQNISKTYPPPFSWLEKYAMQRTSGWVAFGQTIEAALGNRPGYSAKPHRTIPVGVDTERFSPNAELRLATRRELGWEPDGPPVVGYLGRFVPEKGLPLLTRSLSAVKTEWRALFVGGGPMEAELRSWAKTFPHRVRVVTGVPHDRVPAYLNAMDVLAAPSQTIPRWREQLGRMLIEGFACGVAVVGSDSGEIPYVIADAGRIVGESDEASWIATLGELIESASLRAEFGARGRQRAETQFAWSIIARRHLDFFEESLDHQPQRNPQ
jgi:glycosyltransferase involved in cell wall biosynthesis